MSRDSDIIWLSHILFGCPYKLTSKDKLVATYLIYYPEEDGFYKNSPDFTNIIAQQSGLAVRNPLSSDEAKGILAESAFVHFSACLYA